MAVQTDLHFSTDLTKGLEVVPLKPVFFTGDKLAHRFIISVNRDGVDEDLAGATVSGLFIRADDATVTIAGNVDDEGRAFVLLPSQCYEIPGRFQLVIRAVQSTVTSAIFACEGCVRASSTGTSA